jgi:hypothetical protein
MSKHESPSEPGHVAGGEATPAASEGTDERELTEYKVPPGERDRAGARERERRETPEP